MRTILAIHGRLLAGIAGLALLVAALAFLDHRRGYEGFVFCAMIAGFAAGMFLILGRSAKAGLTFREAIFLTASAWLGLPLVACLPFLFDPLNLSFTDAYFETMSGFTTTGSTVIAGLDALPKPILFWRALLQWVGGIGIIGMSIAILPFLRVGGMQLFSLESSDKSRDRLVSRAGDLAGMIALIYLGLSAACMTAYMLAGMTPFDAVTHAMTTVSTGGYSTSDNSMANFSPAAQWAAIPFMLSGAIPFLAYVRLMRPAQGRRPGGFSEIEVFLGMVAGFSLAMLVLQLRADAPVFEALRLALFNVTAVITTTGYAVGDYQLWGPAAVALFFVITFLGGCAGSTSGGFKTFRLQILFSAVRRYLTQLPLPHSVVTARHSGQRITDSDVASVALFVALYVFTFAAASVALAGMGLDFVTAISGAATALANVGPGLGEVIGPAGNFTSLPDGAKWLLSLVMAMGRLEIIVLLMIFTPRLYGR